VIQRNYETKMDCLCSETEEVKTNRIIEKQLHSEKSDHFNAIRILVCGTGDSGKTTLIRQMKIIHLGGFDTTESRNLMPIICQNIIQSSYDMVKIFYEKGITLGKVEYLCEPDERKNVDMSFKNGLASYFYDIPPTLGALIKPLLDTKEFYTYLETYGKSLHFPDGLVYLLKNYDEIAKKGHVPTEKEIIHTKIVTHGVWELKFKVNNTPFVMYDVGGQRIERKNWCSVYDDISCVIFVVAISEYDQVLKEDDQVNRLHESIKQFRQIRTEKRLQGKSLVLFLNKTDLFETKIKKVPLTVCFPDCPKDIANDSKQAKKYILEKMWEGSVSDLYLTRYTCATDKENIQTVFEAVKTFCIKRDLEANGLVA